MMDCLAELEKEEVVASVIVPRKTKDGIRQVRKDVRLLQGKNGMVYVAGTDKSGRTYMVDANGTLFYDSGIKTVGWYAVDRDGEVFNLYPDKDKVKVKPVGDISELKQFQVDEIMGLPIDARRWVAFRDSHIKLLPPNIPLGRSVRDNALRPPLFIDEGEIVLEERGMNPFKSKNGGGKFKFEPLNE